MNEEVMAILEEIKGGLDRLGTALGGGESEEAGMEEEPEMEVEIGMKGPEMPEGKGMGKGMGGIRKIRPGARAGL